MNRKTGNPPSTGKDTATVMENSITILIQAVKDIVIARQHGREMALTIGFSETDSTLIATIISELARNIVLYAQSGEIILDPITNHIKHGIIIISQDRGPGIPDVQRALMGGYSTSGGLGLGLCGVRRMVDEFHIDTGNKQGTTVTVKKWLQ
ncbi:MAG: anti-sigma regulatory factor [Gammaproteobacteria bacterium]